MPTQLSMIPSQSQLKHSVFGTLHYSLLTLCWTKYWLAWPEIS